MGKLPKPLSPKELEDLRIKAQGTQAPAKPATAAQVAYETGISALAPVVARIEVLEKQVAELEKWRKLLQAEVVPGAFDSTTGSLLTGADVKKLETKS